MKNKRGWIKVLEVFVSILLVTGVVVLLLNSYFIERDISEKVSEMEISILREIQLNDSLRDSILDVSLPTNWSDFESSGLTEVRNKIIDKKFATLDCSARVCEVESICEVEGNIDKNVYTESVIISADLDEYSPRKLRLFCWEK